MYRFLFAFALIFSAINVPLQSQDQKATVPGHYLFAWAGDAAHKSTDFLAVIDANPSSPSYGHLVTTLATDQQTMRVHHTEYSMPASRMLFANDHDAGRTFIFDLHDPLHPKIVTSFTDMAGYMHPHSYARLPNGHVLATFQHAHHGTDEEPMGMTGGLVEIDDQGNVIRSASNADPAFTGALLTPYSLVVLPELDRIVSTDSSMHLDNIFAGVTYQVWRLSDLRLLKTAYLDVGENRYAQISPEEPRLGPDGSIFIQTLGCGLERVTAVNTDDPKSQLVYTFPGNWCGVPTIIGHYLVQSVGATHGLIVLDITNTSKPSGSVPAEAGRYLPTSLDGLGLKDAAGRGDCQCDPGSAIGASVLDETQPRNRRSCAGRLFSRHRWKDWLQLRRSRVAARLEGIGHSPRSRFLALKIDKRVMKGAIRTNGPDRSSPF